MEQLETLASSYGNQRCLYPNCAAMVPLQFYQLHLNFCRRKWRGPVVSCPYNGTHRYGLPEDAFHQHVCPDKKNAAAESRNKTDQDVLEMFVDKKVIVFNRNGHLKSHQHNLAIVTCSADLFGSTCHKKNDNEMVTSDNGHIPGQQSFKTCEEIKSTKINWRNEMVREEDNQIVMIL